MPIVSSDTSRYQILSSYYYFIVPQCQRHTKRQSLLSECKITKKNRNVIDVAYQNDSLHPTLNDAENENRLMYNQYVQTFGATYLSLKRALRINL